MRAARSATAAFAILALCVVVVPAAGQAERSPAGASLSHHHFLHTGSGTTTGPEFKIHGEAYVQWRLEWRCPVGHYAMHVNLEKLAGSGTGAGASSAGPTRETGWEYDAKVYSYGPPNHHSEGVRWDGVERIKATSTFGVAIDKTYRMTFHAAHACHYGMYATWVN